MPSPKQSDREPTVLDTVIEKAELLESFLKLVKTAVAFVELLNRVRGVQAQTEQSLDKKK